MPAAAWGWYRNGQGERGSAAAARHPDGVQDGDGNRHHPQEGAEVRVVLKADPEAEEEDGAGDKKEQEVESGSHEGAWSSLIAMVSGQLTPAETMYCIAWAELQSITSISSRGSWTSQPDWGMGVEGM